MSCKIKILRYFLSEIEEKLNRENEQAKNLFAELKDVTTTSELENDFPRFETEETFSGVTAEGDMYETSQDWHEIIEESKQNFEDIKSRHEMTWLRSSEDPTKKVLWTSLALFVAGVLAPTALLITIPSSSAPFIGIVPFRLIGWGITLVQITLLLVITCLSCVLFRGLTNLI
jgi:hypothetical protein